MDITDLDPHDEAAIGQLARIVVPDANGPGKPNILMARRLGGT